MINPKKTGVYTYNLTEELVIKLYEEYHIEPLGVKIKTNDNKGKIDYSIEPCSLSDGSCNLF